MFMSMFDDIEWTKKGNTETCLHHAKEVAACVSKNLVERWRTSRDVVASPTADIFKCHSSHPIFPATVRKGGSNYYFNSSSEKNKILIKTILGSHLLCVYDRSCQWYETENLAQTPRSAEDKEQIDLEPEQFTLISQKQLNVPQARDDSMQRLTENRETLIRRASEQAAFARTVENGQFLHNNESVLEGSSSTP